jgi:hypothetical protein
MHHESAGHYEKERKLNSSFSIVSLMAREILDSRGYPSVEVEYELQDASWA